MKNTIITLDNNESYFVAATIYYDNNEYALLINVNKDDEHMVVKFSNDELEKVNNEETLNNIYPLLNQNLN